MCIKPRRTVLAETTAKAMVGLHCVKKELNGFFNQKGAIAWTFCQDPTIIHWLEENDQRFIDDGTVPLYDEIIANLDQLVRQDGDIRSAFIASEKVQFYWGQ